jgi:N-acetyl-anhydromuramyl-L-alanine amidase AmpD
MKFGRQRVRATSGAQQPGQKSPFGRVWLAKALPLLLLGAASCVSTEMRNADGAGQVNESQTEVPSWVGAAPGWSKLDQIETWLRSSAGYRAGYWKVQGELLLGEGRLDFARAEATPLASGRSQSMPRSWMARLGSAQEGFRRVLSAPQRNSSQERRARQGLDAISRLKSGLGSPAPHASLAQQTRASWRAQAPNNSNLDLTRGGYQRITIHHTAEVPGTRFDGSLEDSINVMQKVQNTHMAQRNYGDIGYHYLIDAMGRVFEGRNIRYQGAHAGERGGQNNNVGNIGICLIGNFQWGSPSTRAMSALDNLLVKLRQEHGIQRGKITSHGELKATECPGPMLAKWTVQYRKNGPQVFSSHQAPQRTLAASKPPAAPRRSTRTPSTVR